MTQQTPHPPGATDTERINEYERAVCYYTLPKVTHSVTTGLILVYILCLLEAFAALGYGFLFSKDGWTKAGAYSLLGIVILGIVGFLMRAIRNQVLQRTNLAQAQNAPDPSPDLRDVPDPFSSHFLLRGPRNPLENPCILTDNEGNALYSVEQTIAANKWVISTPEGEEIVRVRGTRGMVSFNLDSAIPKRLHVLANGEEIGVLEHRRSLRSTLYSARMKGKNEQAFRIEGRAIYVGEKLCGRIYFLRNSLYLDVKKSAFNDVLLGFFAVMV